MSTAMQGEVIFTKIVQVGKFPGRLVVLRLPKLQLRMKFLIVVTDSHYLNLFTLGKYGDEQFGERSDFFFSSLKLPTN
jgi:hypothetical protein